MVRAISEKGMKYGFWKHVGGGCFTAGGVKLAADDEYRNSDTKESITFYSTPELHYGNFFPEVIEDMGEFFANIEGRDDVALEQK